MANKITNYDDYFDSRDVLERIKELNDQLDELLEDYPEEQESIEEIQDELELMYAIQNEWDDAESFEWGITFIRDSYFETYAEEFAEEIGAIDSEYEWPAYCIDWEWAARELQIDYSSIDFDGVRYWGRG